MVFSVFAFFSGFFICADFNQPVLEKAMPFVYLFRDFSACIGQMQKLISRAEKSAFFQKRNGTAHTRFTHAELIGNINGACRFLSSFDDKYGFWIIFSRSVQFHADASFFCKFTCLRLYLSARK